MKKLFLFINKSDADPEVYNILQRLHSNYQETLREVDKLTEELLIRAEGRRERELMK